MPTDLEVRDLGRADYASTHARMLSIADRVRKGEGPGTILLVEHEPVYTAGRATPADQLDGRVVPVERGGQITYHGPGQLVVYPVVRLPRRDVRAWLAALERFGVAVCGSFGLEAVPSANGTGVFVGGRKVVSIGVAIKGWVNSHGISINADVDPAAWRVVRPCGLDPEIMSDLSRETGRCVTVAEAARAARDHLDVLLDRAPSPASSPPPGGGPRP